MKVLKGLDDAERVGGDYCATCGKPLTLTNRSEWFVFVGKGKVAQQCLDCEFDDYAPDQWPQEKAKE